MNILDKAIEVALKNLDRAGCVYRVVLPSGKEVDTLPAAKRTRTAKVPNKTYHSIYYPVISKMAPGELQTIKAPEGIDVHDLRSAAAAWSAVKLGVGVLTTQVVGKEIHLLRSLV